MSQTIQQIPVQSLGASSSGSFLWKYSVDTFSDLSSISNPIEGEIARVRFSQGTQWLPGGLGGTYYPSGFYEFRSSAWEIDDTIKQIAEELENIIDDKLDSVQGGTNVTIDNSDPLNPIINASGGSGGQVDSVVAGTNISIDDTDPVNPIVAVSSSDITDLSTHSSTELNDVTSAGSGSIITAAERTNLSNQSGTNTGDQDLSSLALKSNVLELDNTTAFTPDADYEPATKKYVDDNSAGGTSLVACCPFGAKSDSIGKFLIANGKSTDADDSTKPKTRQPIGLGGTLTKLVYKTKEGTTSTQMKIHVNGTVEQTVNLTNINSNFGGVETISISVSAGDYVEIEYDASDSPGECTMYFIEEL